MRQYRRFAVAVALLLATLGVAHSAEVLQQAPRDALGLVVVRNLSEADAKSRRVLSAFGAHLPGPLALLKSIAGVQAGLDERRDLMLVLLPPQINSPRLSLALWLPVNDYAALVLALDGDPARRVAAVTLAGEDLLAVRQGEWAVLMDPDQRDRLEALSETNPSPPQNLKKWSSWVDSNDVTVVVLPAGRKAAWAWADSEDLFSTKTEPPADGPLGQQLFGRPIPRPRQLGNWPAIRQWIQSVFAQQPELAKWAAEVDSGACGVRLARDGSAVLGVKLELAADTAAPQAMNADPLRIYTGGEFVLTGSGHVSPPWVVPAVAPYVRQVVDDLATDYATPVDEASVAEFRGSIERSVAEVRAFAVLTRPGVAADAVFSNNFLALRVDDCNRFRELAAQSVDRWNEMLGNPHAAVRLVFKSKAIAVGGHEGTEYSIDMAAAVDAPPETRVSLEKLFGPGGLFRLQLVEIDSTTVLLACATEDQIAQVVAAMHENAGLAGEPDELGTTANLLGDAQDWRFFLSPQGSTAWLKRQMDAVLGPVIGGPIVPQFPKSLPLGLAGGVEGHVVWVEMAAPIDLIRGAAAYFKQ